MKNTLAHSRQHLAEKLKNIARQAGYFILDYYHKDFLAKKKEDGSWVTQVDQEAEKIILTALRELAPLTPIISEEAYCQKGFDQGKNEDLQQFFLVDPLDGTIGFINKTGHFTVNIALVEQRRPVLGILYAPFYDRMFYAFWDESTHEPQAYEENEKGCFALTKENKQTNPTKNLPESVIVIVSSRDQAPVEDYFALQPKIFKMPLSYRSLKIGSALKFGLVATGEADLYICKGQTMEWDTAAGHVIVECAGGLVRLWDDQPLLYGKKEVGFKNQRFVASRWNEGDRI